MFISLGFFGEEAITFLLNLGNDRIFKKKFCNGALITHKESPLLILWNGSRYYLQDVPEMSFTPQNRVSENVIIEAVFFSVISIGRSGKCLERDRVLCHHLASRADLLGQIKLPRK